MSRSLRLPQGAWVALPLAGLTVMAAAPLLTAGWFRTHDDLDVLLRIVALADDVRGGDLYPRWLSQSYCGKGSPMFDFYPPAFFLLAAWLRAAGLSLLGATKLVAMLAFWSGAVGMFLWARRHYSSGGALLAAVLYLFVPYHFLDLYVRGALAEFGALAVLPYLFHGIDRSATAGEEASGAVATGLGAAALLLSHNLSALMAAPFAALYACWRLGRERLAAGTVAAVAAGPLLGAGLSAFYWLPLLAERRHLHDLAASVTTGYYGYAGHFVDPRQWLDTRWGFGYSLPGPRDEMSFQVGAVLLGCCGLALLVRRLVPPPVRRYATATLLLGLLGLLLTTEYAAPLYRLVPAFAFVQFPWRFLGPATLFLAAAGGSMVEPAFAERWRPGAVAAVAALAVLVSAGQRTVNEPLRIDFAALERQALAGRELGSLCQTDEFLPRWAPRERVRDCPAPEPVAQSGAISAIDVGRQRVRFTFEGSEPSTVTVPRHYFPGWRAEVDGRPVPVIPTAAGHLSLPVPAGRHEVEVRFGTTWPRIAGWAVAAAALALLLGAGAVRGRRRAGNPQPPGRAGSF